MVFDAAELTMEEYERVETAYIEAFVAFAQESKVQQLQVRGLEIGDGLQDGEILSLANAGAVVRRMLREEVICKLEDPSGGFALHVGFDLYMYVGSTHPCPSAERRARLLGLFVEPDFPSPLWPGADE